MVATLPSVLPCNRMRGRNKIADYVSRFCEILTKDGALQSCKMGTVCNNGRNAPMAHVRCPHPRHPIPRYQFGKFRTSEKYRDANASRSVARRCANRSAIAWCRFEYRPESSGSQASTRQVRTERTRVRTTGAEMEEIPRTIQRPPCLPVAGCDRHFARRMVH